MTITVTIKTTIEIPSKWRGRKADHQDLTRIAKEFAVNAAKSPNNRTAVKGLIARFWTTVKNSDGVCNNGIHTDTLDHLYQFVVDVLEVTLPHECRDWIGGAAGNWNGIEKKEVYN